MKDITIDKVGRLLVPKSVREMLGLRPGSKLRILVRGNEIILKRKQSEPGLIKQGHMLVHQGEISGPVQSITRDSVEDVLDELRTERLNDLARADG